MEGNADQKTAVATFNEGSQTELDIILNLRKRIIDDDAIKQQKKRAKKEDVERTQQDIAKMKEGLFIHHVLRSINTDSVRDDFFHGKNGAIKLSEEELKYLNSFYEIIIKQCEEGGLTFALQKVAEHYVAIMDGKQHEVVGTTYNKLKEIIAKINQCGYFDQVHECSEATRSVEEPQHSTGFQPQQPQQQQNAAQLPQQDQMQNFNEQTHAQEAPTSTEEKVENGQNKISELSLEQQNESIDWYKTETNHWNHQTDQQQQSVQDQQDFPVQVTTFSVASGAAPVSGPIPVVQKPTLYLAPVDKFYYLLHKDASCMNFTNVLQPEQEKIPSFVSQSQQQQQQQEKISSSVSSSFWNKVVSKVVSKVGPIMLPVGVGLIILSVYKFITKDNETKKRK